jgi:hypothetical protein
MIRRRGQKGAEMVARKSIFGIVVMAFSLGLLTHRVLSVRWKSHHLEFAGDHSVTWRERPEAGMDGDLLIRESGRDALLVTFKSGKITYAHFDPASTSHHKVIVAPGRRAIIIEDVDGRYITRVSKGPPVWVLYPDSRVR